MRPGPPEVLEVTDLPDPVPRPGEVVIAVEVAATTFDTQLRAGRGPRPLAPGEFPLVLGNGVAGKVAAVGGGVDRSWLGAAGSRLSLARLARAGDIGEPHR